MMRLAKTVGALVILMVAIAVIWNVTYPDQNDPKNMRYVLWKHGLMTMNLDTATGVIEEDPEGKRDLIIGKTTQQIRDRFGYLLTPHQAGHTLEQCIRGSWAEGKNPMYIRRSNLVVTFDGGVATNADILKPC
jgi:hypothetical protein